MLFHVKLSIVLLHLLFVILIIHEFVSFIIVILITIVLHCVRKMPQGMLKKTYDEINY